MSSEADHVDESPVLVCGAGGLIGRQICRTLAADRHRLVIHARQNADRLESLRQELSDSVVDARLGDLAEASHAADMLGELRHSGLQPKALVLSLYAPFAPHDVVDETDQDIALHLASFHAHYVVCQEFLRSRQGMNGGSVVLVTGALSDRIFPGFSLVSSMKSALHTFAKVLALEAGPQGITVNCVAPGRIVPPGEQDDDRESPGDDPRGRLAAMSLKRMALSRFPTAVDVADTVAFLVSERARQITGQTVFLSAGEPS